MKRLRTVFLLTLSLVLSGAMFLPRYASGQEKIKSDSLHYVLPEFVQGYAKMKNGKTDSAVMNYNMLTEEMIFEQDTLRLAVKNQSAIDTVYLGSRVFVPNRKIFYELLVPGKVSLFKQHKRNILVPGSPAGYGGTTETGSASSISHLSNFGNIYKLELPSEYHLTDGSVLWIRYNNSITRVSTEKKLLKLFPEVTGRLKQFIDQNKLDIEKQEDLEAVIRKCNDLVN